LAKYFHIALRNVRELIDRIKSSREIAFQTSIQIFPGISSMINESGRLEILSQLRFCLLFLSEKLLHWI